MTKQKSTKRALLLSALSLLMCVSMLIGSTFAWFTDSVTSGNNKIVAGTLQIDLELLDKETGKWNSLKNSNAAIFDYENWEPGYTDVKILKVENEGTLALKWLAKFVSENELSELANVIDVYVKPSATEFKYDAVDERTDLTAENGWTNVGTVADFVNTISTTTTGTLEAKESAYLGIALKMQETAGNKYQGMDLGGAFDIMILATQLTSESDSFDNQYDKDAKLWDGTVPEIQPDSLVITPDGQGGTITVMDGEALVYLSKLNADWSSLVDGYNSYYYMWGWTVELGANIDMQNLPVETIHTDGWKMLDGNGYTISNVVVNNGRGLFDEISVKDLTVENVKVKSNSNNVGAVVGDAGTLSNVHIVNATVVGGKYVGGIAGKTNVQVDNCSVKNSTVTGSGKTVGGLVGYAIEDSTAAGGGVYNCVVENVTVTGTWNVGGLLGQAQSVAPDVFTVEGNTVKNVKVVSTSEMVDPDANEKRSAEVAARIEGATIGANTVGDVSLVYIVDSADSLKAALANGGNVVLTNDIAMTAPVTVPASATVVLDLNGNKLSYNSTTQNEAMITNNGTLTIDDSVGGGEIYYNYTGAADGTYSTGNYTINNMSTLTVNGGKIYIANLKGHAKYPINNDSWTSDAVVVINGGHLYNYNTMAIRQFCRNATYKNSVTVNGGLLEGYSVIWMQNPGSSTVNGQLTVTGGELRSTAKAYVEGTSELKDVGSGLYCSTAGGTWSNDSFIRLTGGIFNENIKLAEQAPADITCDGATFNGYVALP